MSLEKLIAENMLRLNIKNLNESTLEKLTDNLSANIRSDYYSDTTCYDKHGVLVENIYFLQEQTKMRRAMGAVRRAVQSTPLMVKWQNWRTKKFIKKNGLPTRQELMAKDSEQVKNTPGYREIMYLLYNKRTMDPASIMYWNGAPALGGDSNPDDKREMGQIITQLARFNGVTFNSGFSDDPGIKLEFNNFIEALKKLYDQGVFLTRDDFMESLFDSDSGDALYALMSLAVDGQYAGQNLDINTPAGASEFATVFKNETGEPFRWRIETDLKRLENFASKLSMAAGGREGKGSSNKGEVESIATYEVSISDQDKIKLCQGVNTELVEDKQYYPKLKLEDYTDFTIGPDAISIKSNVVFKKEKVGDDTVEVVGTYYSYPDNPNDPAQANVIFGNNDNITTWNNTTLFVESVRQRIEAIQKDGWKILQVEYNAGARSSKVGTSQYLQGVKNPTEAQKTQGNVKLCEERALNITDAMTPIFKQLLPNAALMVGKPNLHANQGPGWYDYDNSEGRYGPLYEAYRQLLKGEDVTPREFYSARNKYGNFPKLQAKGFKGSQAQILAEYEQVYSPFRGTYAGYALYCYQETLVPNTPKKQAEIDIKTAGSWDFYLAYNVVTITDMGQSMKRWFKSRWRKVKRSFKRIELPKIKLKSLGEGMNLIDICDAYN
jgi:hypothetical protein